MKYNLYTIPFRVLGMVVIILATVFVVCLCIWTVGLGLNYAPTDAALNTGFGVLVSLFVCAIYLMGVCCLIIGTIVLFVLGVGLVGRLW